MTEQTNLAADRLRAILEPMTRMDSRRDDILDGLREALATARQQGREEAVREIRAKALALHPATPAEIFGILDAIAEGTAPDWKEAAVRGYRQGWADAIAGDGGDGP